jgi:hypothetical protein
MKTDPRLSSLVLRWQELRRQGRTVTAQELCADCPELADAVARQIAVLRHFEALASLNARPAAATPSNAAPADSTVTQTLPSPTVLDPGLPSHAGRFRLLGEIARGGMGAVLRAKGAHRDSVDAPSLAGRPRPGRRSRPGCPGQTARGRARRLAAALGRRGRPLAARHRAVSRAPAILRWTEVTGIGPRDQAMPVKGVQ